MASAKKDEDVAMLAQACDAIERTTPAMRQATIDFLVNKYITHAAVDPLAETHELPKQQSSKAGEVCSSYGCKKLATRRWLVSRSAHESARYAPLCDVHGKKAEAEAES